MLRRVSGGSGVCGALSSEAKLARPVFHMLRVPLARMDAQAVCTKDFDAHHDGDGASSERKQRRYNEKGKRVDRDNSTTSHKRPSIREGSSSRRRSSSAAACGTDTRCEDQNNKDDGPNEEPDALRSGRSRSKRGSSTALVVPPPATLAAGEAAAKKIEKRGTTSLPSPSKAKNSGTDGSASVGTAEKKERRRRRSGSSSYASARDQAQPQEDVVTPAVPAAHASHAIQDSKRRKRGRSSRTLSTENVDDGGDEKTRAAPSTGATADKTYCCPNAASFTTGKLECSSPSESVVAQNRGLLLADKGQPEIKPAAPRVQSDEHPAKIMVAGGHTQDSANTLGEELKGDRGVKEAKASSRERDYFGETQGERISESDGSEGGGVVSRRQRRSTTDERPKEKQAQARRVILSPSSALGVHVVDRGATKHLVLTANDAAAGESKPGSSSDRSRDSSTSVRDKRSKHSSRARKAGDSDAHSHRLEQKQLHRRRKNPSGSGQGEPSRNFQDNFATAVVVRSEGNTVYPPLSKDRSDGRTDQTAKGGSHQKEPSGHAVPPAMESTEHGCRDSADNCETKPFKLSKTCKNMSVSPAAGTASTPRHALLAPSFSIVQDTKGSIDVTLPPDIPRSEGDPWGDSGSPLRARSSSSLGRLVPERTARYVLQQESFHADIPDGYIDLASPVRKLGRAGEEASRGPPAARSTHWAVAAGPNKTQRGTEGTPPTDSLSLTPSEVVWRSSSSNCGRKGCREEEFAGRTERRPRASSNPVPIGGDLGSSEQTKGREEQERKLDELSLPTRWTPIEARSLAEEEGEARSDQNERRHERGATPPLSQVRFESVLRGSPREPTGNLGGDGGASGDLMLFRTDVSRHLVSGEQPALFFLRPSENLSVTRIEGTGRLLVTLREEAGSAAAVVIDGATVHDSAAHFGHKAIQTDHRFPYVAGHRYEFQVAPAQGVELAVRGGGGGEGRQGVEAPQGCAVNTSSGLHVAFSVMSAYSKGARVCQKDALRLSLRTFEAPTANGSRQPTKPKSPPTAMTKDLPTPSTLAAAATATADEGISAPRRPSLKEQDHAGDQRKTPSPSVAAALLAPCLSPPPEVKHNHLIGTAPRDEPSAPPAGIQPPAAAPKTPQPSSSTRTAAAPAPAAAAAEGGGVRGGVRGGPVQSTETTGGNQSAGAATRGQRQPGSGVDPASAPFVTVSGRTPPSDMEGATYPSAERLRWNPAWEQQRLLPPSPSAPAETLPPSHAPSLPHIRRHVDSSSTSPRSNFGQLEPSGVARSHHVPRDPAIGVLHRYVLPPGYRAREHPVQSKRYVGAEDEPGTKAARHYYQPAHEERHHGAPRYHHHRYVSDGQRDVASPGHQAGEGVRELEWNRGRRNDRHASGRGYRVSQEQARANSGGRRPSRWRNEGEDGEDWTRNGRPGLTRRSAPQEDPLAAASGDRYGSQATTGGGHNGEEYPRPYRFHHGSRKHKASPQTDDNNGGGYKHGGGCLPPSGMARWEPKKTVGVAVSPDTSRRRLGVAMGRKAAGEQSAFELTEEEAYHVRNGGGYLESLIADKAPRNRGLNEDGWYGGEPGRQRTPQRTENNIGRQPPGGRNSQQDNTGCAARQTGITTSVVTSRPPRWIK